MIAAACQLMHLREACLTLRNHVQDNDALRCPRLLTATTALMITTHAPRYPPGCTSLPRSLGPPHTRQTRLVRPWLNIDSSSAQRPPPPSEAGQLRGPSGSHTRSRTRWRPRPPPLCHPHLAPSLFDPSELPDATDRPTDRPTSFGAAAAAPPRFFQPCTARK